MSRLGSFHREPEDEEVREALDELYGELRGVKPNTTEPWRRSPLDHERKGKERTSPVIDYVRSLGDYMSTGEVAKELGMSDEWVRKAARNRWTQAPSYVAPFGDTHINLFTDDDVRALKEYIDTHHRVYERDEFFDNEES